MLSLPSEIRCMIMSKYLCSVERKLWLIAGGLKDIDMRTKVKGRTVFAFVLGPYAVSRSYLNLLQWAMDNDQLCHDKYSCIHCKICQDFCAISALNGRLDVLKWLRDNNYPWDEKTFYCAAVSGKIELLEWLRYGKNPDGSYDVAPRSDDVEEQIQCPWNEKACFYAALKGHFNVLRWLRSEENHPYYEDEENNIFGGPCPWNSRVCAAAARKGSLEILQWLRSEENHPYYEDEGNNVFGGPCPWFPEVYVEAAKNGHLHIMKWAKDNDCKPLSDNVCSVEGFQLICKFAKNKGHFHIIEWLESLDLNFY